MSATALACRFVSAHGCVSDVRLTASSFLGPVVGVLPGAACWGSAPAGTRSLLTTTDGAQVGGERP